jgi:hypothetical protein
MKTELMLWARYEREAVPLKEVAAEYLGLTLQEATRQWSEGKLPLKAFRLRESQKAPLLVHIADLAAMIDKARSES